jgi:hypothetical protein
MDLSDEGPRYQQSVKAALDIMNLLMNTEKSPAITLSKIIYRIMDAMDEAELEMARMRVFISRN